ncbi:MULTISPECIES: sugar-binding protein [Inquilinus]|jgi:ribose transport system substrate-binding protein|uniref:Ribose transport system substrate-binding protein n=1 Tax=Inquilinus ginsengisoli TaxID=363840 RepID=A0ABU1JGP7_9PROT|nr:sugar-binding protein [Inquilinus ginsengisoli]MDR6287797.1 ribose transport system substrate-binding protein [Inquilinus ginsengisoli]
MKRFVLAGLAAAVAAAFAIGPAPAQAADKTIAFVVNGSSSFWTIANKGTDKAVSELKGYSVEFKIPGQSSAAEQRQIVEDMLARGVAGIGISPVDPDNSTALLNKAAGQVPLFTFDSDAPKSDRLLYIGTDNVAAGVQAGELIKKTLPDGGKIMLFVGTLGNANARERVEGIKKAIAGTKIEIVDIRTDDIDFAKAKRNVEDTLTKYDDLAMLVGLYSYNTPIIYDAMKAAGKLGKIKVVGFDEDPVTLRGVQEGVIEGTVVQQPFEFGYQTVKLLAQYIEGDKSFIPADHLKIIPTRLIDSSNVADFQKTMKELLKK